MTIEFDGKTYLTVGEVAKKIGRTAQTVKRWEKEGKIPKSTRLKSNGWRVYSPTQVEEIMRYASPGEQDAH